jgi:catechol 2,3-dioxygenase-like lactoylglutathione lyase family enzyme
VSDDAPTAIAKATDVTHVHFGLPDLERARVFLTDFGLTCWLDDDRLTGFAAASHAPVYLADQSPAACFKGFGIAAADDDLQKLASHDGAAVANRPDGIEGRCVRLIDPDGFQVDVLSITNSASTEQFSPAVTLWNEGDRHQRANHRLSIKSGPSIVRRLGHVVLNVSDYKVSSQWYRQRFGFIPSDEIFAGDPGTVIGAFLRCDRGSVPSDHHSLFLLQGGAGKFEHAAFEVSGLNDLMRGHDHLKRSGAQHEWGVGRHILGSHIFDYWRDPWGFELEHWTDGDTLDSAHPTGRHSLEVLLGTQWGEVHKFLRGAPAHSPPPS